MTEYELIDLIFSAVNGAATVNVFIFTIISAYLVMAWLVGDRLTTAQVTMMNLLYLCTAPMMIWGWLGRYLAALELQNALLMLNPEVPSGISLYVIIGTPTVWCLLILGSVKFMWDIRHPKKE